MITHTAPAAVTSRPGCSPAQRVTRSLLGYGVLAGVVFEASILIQGLTRHGFRLAHDDASLLSNGPLGWLQIVTFLVSGAMTIAFAVGARRALAGHAGGRWGPLLIGVYGAALMAAGLLRADPASGFGPGAPAGEAARVSWHAAGHLASAGIGFSALIVACFVLARYFNRGPGPDQRRRRRRRGASAGCPGHRARAMACRGRAGWPGRMADGHREAPGHQVQAEIAACHVRAPSVDRTDWERIAALYVVLGHLTPSPVIELNRAVAIGMTHGPARGLDLADRLTAEPALAAYCHLPAVRGDLLARLGRLNEAREEFERAAGLTSNQREQALFQARAAACRPSPA